MLRQFCPYSLLGYLLRWYLHMHLSRQDGRSAVAPGAVVSNARGAAATTDLHTLEKQHILAVLERVGGDKTRAAQLLGISRRTLERRVAEWAQT